MNKKKLIDSIREKEKQLAKLKPNADKSVTSFNLYNKLLIEKAEMKKALDESNTNKFVEKIKELMPHKKTRISDYFKSK